MNRFQKHTARFLLVLYTLFCTVTSAEAQICLAQSADSVMEWCFMSCLCELEQEAEHAGCASEMNSCCSPVEAAEPNCCASDGIAADEACSSCNDIDVSFPTPDDQTVTKRLAVESMDEFIAAAHISSIDVAGGLQQPAACDLKAPPLLLPISAEIVSSTILLI